MRNFSDSLPEGWLAFELSVLRRLEFRSVADPFAGESLTAAYLKRWGARVAANDPAQWAFTRARARVENNSEVLSESEVDEVLEDAYVPRHRLYNPSLRRWFGETDAWWFDNVRAGAEKLEPERRALALEFGASAGDGSPGDVVIEAVGSEEGWRRAVELARPGGTVVFFGGLPRESSVPFDAYRLHYEELTLRGAFHHTPRHVRAALAFLASGAVPWERLITHRVGLEGVVPLFEDPPRSLLKAAVLP